MLSFKETTLKPCSDCRAAVWQQFCGRCPSFLLHAQDFDDLRCPH